MSNYYIITEADDDRDDSMAREIGGHLAEAYPGHPWHVRIAQGVLIIKHMRLSAKWAIVRRYSRVAWDAAVRKREVVMAAGEFLERAGLARGKAKDEGIARKVEGIPTKDLVIA